MARDEPGGITVEDIRAIAARLNDWCDEQSPDPGAVTALGSIAGELTAMVRASAARGEFRKSGPPAVPEYFDPERDMPPDGAELRRGRSVIRYEESHSWWQVSLGGFIAGPVARTFSPEGIEIAKRWAAQHD
jgi:hypothetical protein